MNIDKDTIDIYNSAIKQTDFLNLNLTKENIKNICECNIKAIITAVENNTKIIDKEKTILINHYKKVIQKILAL
jgi:hypothetical protein